MNHPLPATPEDCRFRRYPSYFSDFEDVWCDHPDVDHHTLCYDDENFPEDCPYFKEVENNG